MMPDGILVKGTPEYYKHLRECWACREDKNGNTLASQHRPHTGDVNCWCVPRNILNRCIIDRAVWKNLPEVHYIA
jgi:hypothetical protein